jgi:hypothetical protein
VAQLTNLASNKTTMSEAEQRTFVGELAKKETHQLELVKYFTRRTASTIDLKNRQKRSAEYNMKMWGHE